MLKSMTGYGKEVADVRGKTVIIEIKTLNSKQADISIKTPVVYREKDLELRSILIEKLERGKIDLTIYFDKTDDESNFSINKPLAKRYFNELKSLASEMGESEPGALLPILIRLPEVIYPEKEVLDPNEWLDIRNSLKQVLEQVDEFRLKEGIILEHDIKARLILIVNALNEIEKIEKERKENIRERIKREFESVREDLQVDENRFEQELIFYLEKLDITEERVRLKKHCDYFSETLDSNGSQGRKLGFITQEMGREINTIGSKANDASIQKLVIEMKDELEKIKEQLLNIL
jgi:uncharacterized protein (TIGR00255 family)